MDSRCVQSFAEADLTNGIYASGQGWQTRMNDTLRMARD